jgi:hypothetical protein
MAAPIAVKSRPRSGKIQSMKFLREPLVHFILLGIALFAIFGLAGKIINDNPSQTRIVITPAKIDELVKGFKLDFKRAPDAADLDKLVNDYIREEVLCREAWAQGLDKDDRVIRARLRQRMEFFNDSTAADSPTPSDGELAAFLEKNPQLFKQPDGHKPELAEVRDRVLSAWTLDQRRKTSDAAYARLLAKYTVSIAPTTAPATDTADAR